LLPAAELRALRRVSNLRAAANLAFEWAAVGLAILVVRAHPNPVVYVLAVVWIGTRQHAMGLMAHDAAHGHLLRPRALNDWVARLFLAWPVGMSFDTYRPVHLQHHRYVNTENDPDWARNRPDRLEGAGGWIPFLRVMLGLNREQRALQGFVGGGASTARRPLVGALRCVAYAAVVVLAVVTDTISVLVLFWVVPLVTWLPFIMRLRGSSEHFALENEDAFSRSRTVRPSLVERLVIAPKHMGYHLEHHLYPSVPFYRLPALHRALQGHARYVERAHVTSGYWRYLCECAEVARVRSRTR
jgi:fatty acid desaturase